MKNQEWQQRGLSNGSVLNCVGFRASKPGRRYQFTAGPESDDGGIGLSNRQGRVSWRNSQAGEQFHGSLMNPPLTSPLKGLWSSFHFWVIEKCIKVLCFLMATKHFFRPNFFSLLPLPQQRLLFHSVLTLIQNQPNDSQSVWHLWKKW